MTSNRRSEPRVFEVIHEIRGTHAIHMDYPLLPGDVLIEQEDGSFYKTAPGLGITGFRLTDAQKRSLIPRTKVGRLGIVEGGLVGYAASLAERGG